MIRFVLFSLDQFVRYRLWQNIMSLFMASRPLSIFNSSSLFPIIRHTDFTLDINWLNRIIVRTIVPYGALVSSLASLKSNPIAHLYTVSVRWKLQMLIICSYILFAFKLMKADNYSSYSVILLIIPIPFPIACARRVVKFVFLGIGPITTSSFFAGLGL